VKKEVNAPWVFLDANIKKSDGDANAQSGVVEGCSFWLMKRLLHTAQSILIPNKESHDSL
jgi:hypothetical protein